jgi:hypothetical protein
LESLLHEYLIEVILPSQIVRNSICIDSFYCWTAIRGTLRNLFPERKLEEMLVLGNLSACRWMLGFWKQRGGGSWSTGSPARFLRGSNTWDATIAWASGGGRTGPREARRTMPPVTRPEIIGARKMTPLALKFIWHSSFFYKEIGESPAGWTF